MMREPRDRTAEVKTADGRLEIGRSDFCDAFEQDPTGCSLAGNAGTANNGNFGIFTEHPTQKGVCRKNRRKSNHEKDY